MIAAPSSPPDLPAPPAQPESPTQAPQPAPPQTLGDMLTSVARGATEARLTTMMIAGLAGATIVALVLGRKGWLWAAALLAIGAYGAWGMADRVLAELYATPGSPAGRVLGWRLARAISAIVATLAALSALATLFLPMIGLWKS